MISFWLPSPPPEIFYFPYFLIPPLVCNFSLVLHYSQHFQQLKFYKFKQTHGSSLN